MNNRESLSHIYSKTFIIIILIFLLFFLVLYTYFDIFVRYREISKIISKQIINDKKLLLKGAADNIINYINYNYNINI